MTEDNNLIVADNHNDRKGSSGQVKLQIVPSQPKPTLSHLPNRPAVDLAFNNLTYRVKEGRKNSEYCLFPICDLSDHFLLREIGEKKGVMTEIEIMRHLPVHLRGEEV